MFLPVDKSITVSEPHLIDQRIFSTSSSIEEATAELPMLALIFTRKLRPIIIGSVFGWVMFDGMIARPRAISSRTNSGVASAGVLAPPGGPGCWLGEGRPPAPGPCAVAPADVERDGRVRVRDRGVVNEERRVLLDGAGLERLRRREADLPHRDAHAWFVAFDVDLPRSREGLGRDKG